MASAKQPKREYRLVLKLKDYEKVNKDFKSTTFQYLAEYLRAMVLKKPVTIRYRNESADDFLQIALALKKELVRSVDELSNSIKSIECLPAGSIPNEDLTRVKLSLQNVERQVKEIVVEMHKIYTLWLTK